MNEYNIYIHHDVYRFFPTHTGIPSVTKRGNMPYWNWSSANQACQSTPRTHVCHTCLCLFESLDKISVMCHDLAVSVHPCPVCCKFCLFFYVGRFLYILASLKPGQRSGLGIMFAVLLETVVALVYSSWAMRHTCSMTQPGNQLVFWPNQFDCSSSWPLGPWWHMRFQINFGGGNSTCSAWSNEQTAVTWLKTSPKLSARCQQSELNATRFTLQRHRMHDEPIMHGV